MSFVVVDEVVDGKGNFEVDAAEIEIKSYFDLKPCKQFHWLVKYSVLHTIC